ncbi:MAG: NAD(P)-binding domain-containing protein, partial [Ruminococcus sp.]|nr:NAD(P)-binding domain-containing protein [Ruminococcus sp.]
MVITIIGGGNIGTQFAVHCAAKGHNVRILTSAPEVFEKRLTAVD